MDLWAWATIVLCLGLALAALEIFIPSGGVLGFLSIAAVVTSIVLAFKQSPGVGLTFLVVATFGLPAAVAAALHFFPDTPAGRWLLLGVPKSDDVLPNDGHRKKLKALVGKTGVAKSVMLPSGAVTIDGRTIDAVTEGMAVEAGQRIVVVEVRGPRVVVRPVEEHAPVEPTDDALTRPIDTLGLDPFEDPLV